MPPSATCTLSGVTVTGNVKVETNARLNVYNNGTQGSTIDGNLLVRTGAIVFVNNTGVSNTIAMIAGNVEANQCNAVVLDDVIVGGNIHIQNCSSPEHFSSGYSDAQIGGNFTCNDNTLCGAFDGNVRGNVQINDNADAVVSNNTIGGNLQCKGNTTIQDASQPNTVGGNKQGQCAGANF